MKIVSIFDRIRDFFVSQDIVEENVIDLSDTTKYPASVLADLNCTFALGDDSENFLHFLHGKWTQPSFHWGWDDITHEEAVGSEFLFRAYSLMNTQYRKRRDALIASEGYRFIWKNKDIEPVSGVLSGEQLCDMANRCLERDLKSAKDINAYEDRDARRWQLNPTFDELMADLEKSDDQADYYHRDMGYGMLRFSNRSYGNRGNVNQLEHNGDAKRLVADYGGLSIGDYQEGIARVDWMLYPDGRYFADEDGFGMEDNDEVNVSAYIDTECRVLVKFQDMDGKSLYGEALKKLNEINS